VEEAKVFIGRIRAEFADASHNVPAYLVGHGSSVIAHCGDDGEPSGTAGRPMLAVLQGSGLGDVAVVVTRYFGGTKLGTGGLVRAYGGAARTALAALPTRELVWHRLFRAQADYGQYGSLKYLLPKRSVRVTDESFTERVMLELAVPYDEVTPLEADLRELSNGAIALAEREFDGRYEERLPRG